MKKKVLGIGLAMLGALSLVGCASDGDNYVFHAKTTEVCIVDNPDVRAQVFLEIRRALMDKGYDVRRLEYGDLADVEGDALLKFVRKELRSRYGFPKGNTGKKMGVPVVFSREISGTPEKLDDARFPHMISPAGGKPRPGTVAFVTGAFGLALARLAVEQVLKAL